MRNVAIFDLPFRGRCEFSAILDKPGIRAVRLRPYDFYRVFPEGAQLIIIPGSAKTTADLEYLRATGGESIIRRHLSNGQVIVGICGGFQQMGMTLSDPGRSQGKERFVAGMGLLPMRTVFGPRMMSCKTRGALIDGGGAVHGVEHRSGSSMLVGRGASPLLRISERVPINAKGASGQGITLPKPQMVRANHWDEVLWAPGREPLDGLCSSDRKVWGTYVHLAFDNKAFTETVFAHSSLGS